MDNTDPKLTGVNVAKALGVTPQAVSGWRRDGRVHKKHLMALADLTGRDPTYFLGHDPKIKSGAETHSDLDKDHLVILRACENPDNKAVMLALAKGMLKRDVSGGKKRSS